MQLLGSKFERCSAACAFAGIGVEHFVVEPTCFALERFPLTDVHSDPSWPVRNELFIVNYSLEKSVAAVVTLMSGLACPVLVCENEQFMDHV